MLNRRQFLSQSFAASAIAIGSDSWLHRSIAMPDNNNPHRLIVIFLRGAIDGLNVIVPYGDSEYYRLRPTIAIPQPNIEGGAIDLDGQFGLHPSLKSIYPLWQQKSLAFVHACGSPVVDRSHFAAQDNMEIAAYGLKSSRDGWLNRLVGTMTAKNPIQAVSVGATTPRILAGKNAIANLASGRIGNNRMQIDKPDVSAAFDRLYKNNNRIGKVYREGRASRVELLKDLEAETKEANKGAPLPNGFAADAQRLARLMVRDPRIQIAFFGIGGWDTHINQGGQLSRNLTQLGNGLATLQRELGAVYQNTTIVVMSEFGRTARENGNNGTDHGYANGMWLMGGNLAGGKFYGKWPGLMNENLYQNRDLAVTTDFRSVLKGILKHRMSINDRHLTTIFPNDRSTVLNIL
jgi:uncharacterized protein (DUF1501 family)